MKLRVKRGILLSVALSLVYIFAVLPAANIIHGGPLINVAFVSTNPDSGISQTIAQKSILGSTYQSIPIAESAYIGGFPVAMLLFTDGVIIEEIGEVETSFGKSSPSSDLNRGDFLTQLNGVRVENATDIERILDEFYASKLKKANANIDCKICANGLHELSGDFKKINLKDKIKTNKDLEITNKDLEITNFIPVTKQESANQTIVSKQHFFGKMFKSILSEKRGLNKVDETPKLDTSFDAISAIILRNGERIEVEIRPAIEEFSNKLRLGLSVRDYILGVGMVSFVKEDGSFGALGHPVTDQIAGNVPISDGQVFYCDEAEIIKGERGKPGEFRVKINSLKNPIGDIEKNNERGVFGNFFDYKAVLERFNPDKKLSPVPIAPRKLVSVGNATICTTIDGKTSYYNIDIIKAAAQNIPSDKGLVIRVTDKKLIEKTGGIIQGMSGSPIIQNGALVGAVTHVFINDPTKGYGLYMDFMY
ncbi:MAG: hypothetical protein FWD86_02535 [Firmicutes bacterium]|nr:hypothetical protein [Bacillota bacterium]